MENRFKLGDHLPYAIGTPNSLIYIGWEYADGLPMVLIGENLKTNLSRIFGSDWKIL